MKFRLDGSSSFDFSLRASEVVRRLVFRKGITRSSQGENVEIHCNRQVRRLTRQSVAPVVLRALPAAQPAGLSAAGFGQEL